MNVRIHFFTHRSYDSHLCGKSTAITIKILNFCDIRAVVFLQSYVIMPVSRLRKTENKRICQMFGLKSGRVTRVINLSIGRFLESYKQYLTEKQNPYGYL